MAVLRWQSIPNSGWIPSMRRIWAAGLQSRLPYLSEIKTSALKFLAATSPHFSSGPSSRLHAQDDTTAVIFDYASFLKVQLRFGVKLSFT
ncbi:hypothetical protein HYPSUDRAFT_1064332 [Hypholoma sublateritium FD-334 SS-4]|uniref:Uncharacterized protein n=1 Tax=Hypholoma sublateritium (strain FD-334 SS-4) TaxID=945553 RepID=A0A0D2KPG7_HYPSF|nr:hypothetical protein HYPSUDRAFT_1064332 [Hypholoma sublateritium FD-334 SS-4]